MDLMRWERRENAVTGPRLALALALGIAIAIVLWLLFSGGSDRPDGPEAISKVAGWLREDTECPEGVELEVSRIPVGPHGPPGTFFQLFGELPEAGALTSCTDTIGGFIGWFRFPNAADLKGAMRRHSEIAWAESTCTRGRELLIDALLGNDRFFPEYCRRLDFELHPSRP
jgi:hypothetical protein